MKRIILVLFLSFLLQSFVPVSATPEEILELREGIRNLTQKVQNQLDDYPEAKSVIVLGPTGSGKSTLINLLAGKPFSSQQANIGFKVYTNDPLPEVNIGDGNIVGTRIPCSWVDRQNNIVFWDCPGFGDPRGPKADIINAFSIHELFKQNIKIILNIEEARLTIDRATGFLRLLKELTNIFQDNQQIKQGLSLIVSKQNEAHNIPGYLQQQILPLSQQDQIELTPEVRDLLQFLVEHPERISFFPKANNIGSYDPNMQVIRQAINSSSYIQNPKASIKIDANAMAYVDCLGKSLNQYITDYMKNDGHRAIIDYCRNLMNEQPNRSLINKFKSLENSFKDIQKTVTPQNPNLFPEKLVAVLGKEFKVKDISATIENLSFLRTIKKDIPYHTSDWTNPLFLTLEHIQDLTENIERKIDIQELKSNVQTLTIANQKLSSEMQELRSALNSMAILSKPTEDLKGMYTNSGYGNWLPYTVDSWKLMRFTQFCGNQKLNGDLSSMTIPEDGIYYLSAHYAWKANNLSSILCGILISINSPNNYVRLDNHEGCYTSINLSPTHREDSILNCVRKLKQGDKVALAINGHPAAEYYPDWFMLIVEKIN